MLAPAGEPYYSSPRRDRTAARRERPERTGSARDPKVGEKDTSRRVNRKIWSKTNHFKRNARFYSESKRVYLVNLLVICDIWLIIIKKIRSVVAINELVFINCKLCGSVLTF